MTSRTFPNSNPVLGQFTVNALNRLDRDSIQLKFGSNPLSQKYVLSEYVLYREDIFVQLYFVWATYETLPRSHFIIDLKMRNLY